jgi:hypothetical protein
LKKYIEGLNKHLEKQMEDNRTNIFLYYSRKRMLFEDILKIIFDKDYKYKNEINKRIIEELKDEYERIKSLCDILYELK